jgi:hypothetical protein
MLSFRERKKIEALLPRFVFSSGRDIGDEQLQPIIHAELPELVYLDGE